jgi:hypothetical protein
MTTTSGPVFRSIALIITLAYALAACTSLQGVPMPPDPGKTPAVKVGEKVEVTKKNGDIVQFRVTAVEPDALVGKDVRVAYSDIGILQVERTDPAQTNVAVWVTVGVILTGLLIYGLSHLGALSSDSP